MKHLYLLRHAHAEPHGLGFSDFDRPLDERGHVEAKEVAHYLHQHKITFDYVMCSAALRAQETLEPLRPYLGTQDIEISDSFYNISEDKILEYLRLVNDEKEKVLYIGHNPGIAFASLKLAKVAPPLLMEGIKPATLIGFEFPYTHWITLDWGQGEVRDVVVR